MENVLNNALFKTLVEKSQIKFDYEIQNIILDESDHLNSKMYYYDKATKKNRIINYNSYWDSLEVDETGSKKYKQNELYRAFCVKRLVSKKKKRFQNEHFDLDMAYVTRRIIAMGFPSTGCESLYRNSLSDVLLFFQRYHNNQVKVFNLCIEKERVYERNLLQKLSVGLFPSKDHNPCPIKLILDFCVDVVLYLIKNPQAVAAVHCKAGKGRTGVMICCYLIFSGLCKDSDEAMEHYSLKRTLNKKGVTIKSQIRYIRYFEAFLKSNFSFPYIYMIPRIIKYQLNKKTFNLIDNFMKDDSYYFFRNKFRMNSIKIGPFTSGYTLNINIVDILINKFEFIIDAKKKIVKEKSEEGHTLYYFFTKEISRNNFIMSDFKMLVTSSDINFEFWANMWHNTLGEVNDFFNLHSEEFKKTKFLENFEKESYKIEDNYKSRDDNIGKSNIEMREITEDYIDSSRNLYTKSEKYDKIATVSKCSTKRYILEEEESIYKEELNDFMMIKKCFQRSNQQFNLNEIIDKINYICSRLNIKPINKNELNIFISANGLDKFTKSQNMLPDFRVQVNYSILEN